MKNAFWALPIAVLAFLMLVIGMLIGRSVNGEQIVISYDKEANRVSATEPSETVSSFASDGKININTASAEHLMMLPDIGETIAIRIIEYRTKNGSFSSVDELLMVKGIGVSTLEKIREMITVGG